jgi:hypothetical protein
MIRTFVAVWSITTAFVSALPGAEPAANSADDVRSHVERSIRLLQKAATNYPTHRECFACHHQTMPLLAMDAASPAGVKIDNSLRSSIVEFTADSFESQTEKLKSGEGVGGRGLTVGYGLWTLQLAGRKPDDLTDAMVSYLLKIQDEDGHWGLHSVRPPMEESLVTCTVLAAYGIKQFASDTRRTAAEAAIEKACRWLAAAKFESLEDRASRLWGLHLLKGTAEEIAAARKALLDTQRDDGGWAQNAEMTSDAYATGFALFVLSETGFSAAEPAYQRGIKWLLAAQQEDGSWFVQTRAKPVQMFFDNGDPHGKSQFISISATGWAATALARSLPGK